MCVPLVHSQGRPFDLCDSLCVNVHTITRYEKDLPQTNKTYNVIAPRADKDAVRSSQETFRIMASFV